MRKILIIAALTAATGCRAGRSVTASDELSRGRDTLTGVIAEELDVTLSGVEFHTELAGEIRRAERIEIRRGRVAGVEASASRESAAKTETEERPARGIPGPGRWVKLGLLTAAGAAIWNIYRRFVVKK